jgi:hypothetical protein
MSRFRSRSCLFLHCIVGQPLSQRTLAARSLVKVLALSSILSLFFCNTGDGQVIVARDSYLNYNYTFGGGAVTFSDNQTLNPTSLVLFDNLGIGHSQMESGANPPGPWSAGIDVSLAQQFEITGSLSNFSRIQANASSTGETFTSGFGSAGLFSSNPGNRLLMSFNVNQAQDYTLIGDIAFTGASSTQSAVALQRWDGIVWQNVHNSAFLLGGQGAFNWSGTLNPGEYRMFSGLNLSLPGGNQSSVRAYQYEFRFTNIPEPSSATALLIGMGVVLFRRRR